MDSERWKQVDTLFHVALERDPADRAAFLDDACGQDDDLRHEVESLLAAASKGQRILDLPIAALLDESSTIELKPGARLGPYEIERLIGEGDMGKVCKTRDTRLGRKPEIYVAPFPGPGGKRQISTAGGLHPRWRDDGNELFYAGLSGTLMAAEIAANSSRSNGQAGSCAGASVRWSLI